MEPCAVVFTTVKYTNLFHRCLMGSRHPPAPPPIYHAGRGLFCLANFINCLIDIYSSGWFCLKRKPTNQPRLCLFVIRACDTFGEPGLVLTETGEPCPGLGLMPLSFIHLWFKSKFLRLTSTQQSQLLLDQGQNPSHVPSQWRCDLQLHQPMTTLQTLEKVGCWAHQERYGSTEEGNVEFEAYF